MDLFQLFCFTFISSAGLTGVIVLTVKYQGRYTLDYDMQSKQKFHHVPTPRIGGVPILLSFIIGLIAFKCYNITDITSIKGMLLPIMIIFCAGLLDDMLKTITPLERLLLFIIALIIAIYITNSIAVIIFTDFDIIDEALAYFPFIGIGLTFFCIIGLTNAYNIIDGYNGLAALTAIFNLLGLAVLAYLINDFNMVKVICAFIAAIAGFLVYNYPKGKIFLGDGGAYLIGFFIAAASLQLAQRNPGLISPYAPLLMAIYPVTEVVFAIYRKIFLRHTPSTQPDGLHFHMMIYKRCTNFDSNFRNSSVVVIIMLSIMLPQIVLAIIVRQNSIYCLLFTLIFVLFYIYLYFHIIWFKTPAILKIILAKSKHLKKAKLI